jgi:hypothetical protein
MNGQAIIEKFRSEGNARNPLKQIIRNTNDTDNAITDFNGNGSEDIVAFAGSDEELKIIAYDGSTYNEIFNIGIPQTFQIYAGDQVSRIPLLYPLGSGLDYLIITMENIQEGDRTLIINPKDEGDFIFVPGRTILIADMDGDGWIDVLSIDVADRSLVVHGIDNGSGIRNEVPALSSRGKREISLIYESEPNVRFNIESIVPINSKTQDINNDGAVDVTIVRRDENDRVSGIRVMNVLTQDVLFQKSLEGVDEEINRLLGYYDIDGDGIKEVMIGNNMIIDQNGDITSIADDFRIQGILDLNGDDVDDIIGINTSNNSVQVWGLNNSTSTEDIEKKLGQLANFPNPFLTNTTIEYQLETEGEVRIEIRNSSAELITSIIPGKKPPGTHKEFIILDEVPGGIYYYSIVVDSQVTTQKMIKL